MTAQQTYGFLHCHTEHSLKDSPLSVKELCQRAAEMGAKAVSITDHGTCTGVVEFMDTCKEYGINGIPGVEAYVKTKYANRAHLVLLAKNYEGYQEISRAVTEANKHLENVAKIMMPVMDKEILKTYCSNGNVIAMSACIQGVLGSIYSYNHASEQKINKLKTKLNALSNPRSEDFLQNTEKLNRLDEKIEQLQKEKDSITALSKKTYTKRKKALSILESTDYESYLVAKEDLEKEIAESEQAKIELVEIRETLKKTKSLRTNINTRLNKAKKDHQKYFEIEEEIIALQNSLIPQSELHERAKMELRDYLGIFGPNFYIELQNHGMEEERKIMPLLAQLAQEEHVPVVATNDIHIKNKEQAEARQFLKALRFEQWEEAQPSELELYMKSDKELYEAICDVVPVEIAKESILNIRTICHACHVEIPEIPHYPKYRDESGKEVEDSPKVLREKTIEGIARRFPNGGFDETYQNRMEYELYVITSLGYADYLLIVADFLNYAQHLSMTNNEWGIGYGTGPGRGSGCGSLVNYLLGITQLDPLKYGLLFERFLNKDRVSMPDIDSDFSDETREATIEYVKQKYGEDSVACIRTTITQGAKGAIRSSARIRGWEMAVGKESDSTVKQKRKKYKELGDTIAGAIPDVPGISFAECEEELKPFETDEDGKVIIRRAKMTEGNIFALSIHAAGIIIGDGHPLSDYIPLLYNTKKEQWAVQCDMVEAERMKLLKMDFLGLKNLDIITECVRNVKAKYGISIDCNNLPFKKEVITEIFAKGNTDCIFQFESGGMKQMLQDFQPETFEDIILLVAAYRPGPMEFIPDIIAVKRGEKQPKYVVPALKDILELTYGQPIYQEQLMEIFHTCAGFSLGEADIIRRYMSKKKVEKFLAYQPQFVEGIKKAGASEKEAMELWDSLTGFAKYGFNKSHAAAYAYVAYITAYLKYYYPEEYMCASLNHVKTEKIPMLLHNCKEMGIQILPPDINRSYEKFITDNDGNIIYGLNSIKGINKHAESIISHRREDGNYENFFDFFVRAHQNKGVTEKLIKAGVFSVCDTHSRTELLSIMNQQLANLKAMRKKITLKNKTEEELNACEKKSERAEYEKKIERINESIERIKIKLLQNESDITLVDDTLQNLKDEYEILGAYVSGHPLDSYQSAYKDKNITYISNLQPDKIQTIIGMISNLRITNRKKDGAKMAFFQLIDPTGELSVKCFAEAYKEYASFLQEGEVIQITGKCKSEPSFQDEDEDVFVINVQQICSCIPEKPPIFLSVKNMKVYETVRTYLKEFEEFTGYPIYLHDSETGTMYEEDFRVSADVLELRMENTYIRFLSSEIPEKAKRIMEEE